MAPTATMAPPSSGPHEAASATDAASAAAILAAAKQRRLLLKASQDPNLLDEFGPLGAPSPTKTPARSRRRVVSEAAPFGWPSEDDPGYTPSQPTAITGSRLDQRQQEASLHSSGGGAYSADAYQHYPQTTPLRPRNRWEEDWSGNAAAAAMGMTSPATELLRRSSNASAQLLQTASEPRKPEAAPEPRPEDRGSARPNGVSPHAAPSQSPVSYPHTADAPPRLRKAQEPRGGKTVRQLATVSSPSLRQIAKGSSTGTESSTASSSVDQQAAVPKVAGHGPYLQPPLPQAGPSSSSDLSPGPSSKSSSSQLRPSASDSRMLQNAAAGSGRSVSAPYVTHDFDEMLPPAVARRLEQQRLMAMDPRLSRVEGLIETWDRNGLPLSTRDLWQKQQAEAEAERAAAGGSKHDTAGSAAIRDEAQLNEAPAPPDGSGPRPEVDAQQHQRQQEIRAQRARKQQDALSAAHLAQQHPTQAAQPALAPPAQQALYMNGHAGGEQYAMQKLSAAQQGGADGRHPQSSHLGSAVDGFGADVQQTQPPNKKVMKANTADTVDSGCCCIVM